MYSNHRTRDVADDGIPRLLPGVLRVTEAGPTVREALPTDAGAVSAAWLDAARYYEALDSRRFRVPSDAGIVDWLSGLLERERGEDELWIVVEIGGRVVGDLIASLARPSTDAAFQLMRDLGETVLRIDALAVLETDRRRGAGTALMRAAEAWGRERGATRTFLTTAARSELSIPFYEHLGYEQVSVGLWKLL